MGAPIWLSQVAQVASGLTHFKDTLNVLKNYNFEFEKDGYLVRKEPVGVVGMITPWNWPMNQMCTKVASGIAAGCTMVLKPSEITPFCGIILAEIIHAAGVPAGVFNLVNGMGPVVGAAMSEHKDIDMMHFTGSPMIKDPFHSNRWDYLNLVTIGDEKIVEKKLIVIFDDENLLSSWKVVSE